MIKKQIKTLAPPFSGHYGTMPKKDRLFASLPSANRRLNHINVHRKGLKLCFSRSWWYFRFSSSASVHLPVPWMCQATRLEWETRAKQSNPSLLFFLLPLSSLHLSTSIFTVAMTTEGLDHPSESPFVYVREEDSQSLPRSTSVISCHPNYSQTHW